MAFAHSPKISTSNLVFYYDVDNIKSFRGEPTTNLVTNGNFSNGSTGWSYNGSAASYSEITTFEGRSVFKSNGLTTYNDRGYISQVVNVTSGQTYTISFEYYLISGQLTYDPDGASNNNAFFTSPTGEWRTHTDTFTAASSTVTINLWGVNANPGYWYITNIQCEQKSHKTPFVNGTRPVATGLKDLAGKASMDLSNLSFDSNAQMTFDGSSDYISMNAQNLVGATAGTVSAWVNLAQANVNHAGIFCCQVGPAWADMRVVLNVSTPNRIRLAISDGTNSTQDSCRTNSTLSYNTWYHIVATYDGTSAKIYVNGVLDETHNTTITPGTFTPGATMVGYQNYSNRYFNGDIAAVATYNKALTASEIKANFNAIKGRFGI